MARIEDRHERLAIVVWLLLFYGRMHPVACAGAGESSLSHRRFFENLQLRAVLAGPKTRLSSSARDWMFRLSSCAARRSRFKRLATESIYVANVGTDGVIGAVDKGLDLAMIGSLLNNLSMSLVAAKPYKTFDDLRGKTIGSQTITTGTGFAMRLVLRAHGLEYPRDYQILNVGGVTDRYVALQSGSDRRDALERAARYLGQAAGI